MYKRQGENDIDPVLIDFIRQNPEHLRVDPSQVEPGTVCPNPASWHRVNTALSHMSMLPGTVAGSRPAGFYALSLGMVGTEAAIAFTDFVENYELVVSAEDVLDGYEQNKARVEQLTNSAVNGLIDKLAGHCKDNKWTASQAKNVSNFAQTLPGELMVHLWNQCSATQNLPNIQKLHKLIGKKIIESVTASRNV